MCRNRRRQYRLPSWADIAILRRQFDGRGPLERFAQLVRTIPDYPKPGILFRDVTTLMGDAKGFKAAIEGDGGALRGREHRRRGRHRGARLHPRRRGGRPARCGFIPIRKKGKLPWKTIGQQYSLEYGVDIIEIHEDAIKPGERILIVDDLIATGGTAEAAAKLVSRTGGARRRRGVPHRSAGPRRRSTAAQPGHPNATRSSPSKGIERGACRARAADSGRQVRLALERDRRDGGWMPASAGLSARRARPGPRHPRPVGAAPRRMVRAVTAPLAASTQTIHVPMAPPMHSGGLDA